MASDWDIPAGRTWLSLKLARQSRRLRLPEGRGPRVPWTRTALTVATAQWLADPVVDLTAWVEDVRRFFDDAKAGGAALLVFPEDMSLPLLGLLPQRGEAATASAPSWVGARLRAWAPLLEPVYLRVMSALAADAGLTVVAGSTLGRGSLGVENRTWIITPDGRLASSQAKLHLLPLEAEWGLTPGSALAPLPTRDLPLAAFVCHDASFFETYRMATNLGAEVVAIPIADPDPAWAEPKARRGAWARSQETGLPSVVAAMTGSLFGLPLTGKAGVYVPRAASPDGSGVLAESPEPVGRRITLATLDLDALASYRRQALPPLSPFVSRQLEVRYRAVGTEKRS
jgi:predicted amidohydrolase